MKLALVLLACVGLVAGAAYSNKLSNSIKVADKTFLERQKFLFEIVYRVEDPLMFDDYVKLGQKFFWDKSYYTVSEFL